MSPSITKLENGLMNSKSMKFLTSATSSTAVANIAMLSNVSKDIVNCYYYVRQSLNNKKIPDDKRNFVAGLDLANGILNVIIQLGLGSLVVNHSDKIFDKYIAPKFYGEDTIAKVAAKSKNNSLDAIKDAFNLKKSAAKGGMKVIATLFVTTVVCKRILVPLIATPMATFFRKKFEQNERNNNHNAPVSQDSVSFQNAPKKEDEVIHPIVHENLPKCFKSFMK